MAMIGPWVALLAGGLCEAGFTTALRHIDGGRNIGALIAFLLSVTASMGLLALAGRQIPMGTAYAVWAGIGAAATAIALSHQLGHRWGRKRLPHLGPAKSMLDGKQPAHQPLCQRGFYTFSLNNKQLVHHHNHPSTRPL